MFLHPLPTTHFPQTFLAERQTEAPHILKTLHDLFQGSFEITSSDLVLPHQQEQA